MLLGARGLRLHVIEALAKFTFDDHKPPEHRRNVAVRSGERSHGRDLTARQQLRRLHQGDHA
jgi:transcriptional regulator